MEPDSSSHVVCLCIHPEDPCLWLLRVRCCDQVGFLFKLSELLTGRSIDIVRADIATIEGTIDNHFMLRAPRASDIQEANDWCSKLESTLLQPPAHGHFKAESLATACKRLAVNPDLVSVASFYLEDDFSDGSSQRKRSFSGGDCSLRNSGQQHDQHYRYTLELQGINQAGLLAYASLVFFRSGFSIEHAQISTKDGHVADTFVLLASSTEAECMLRAYLDIPQRLSNCQLGRSRSWASDDTSPRSSQEVGKTKSGNFSFVMPSSTAGSPPQQIVLENGDVYDGELQVSNDETIRQGFGSYSYHVGDYLRYTGQWHGDMKHGNGYMLMRDGGAYAGQWRENKPHGIGVIFGHLDARPMQPGEMPAYRYEGEWLDGSKHGLGFEESTSGAYCGHFKHGKQKEGLRIDFPRKRVADCSVLQDGSWHSFLEMLEIEASNTSGQPDLQENTSMRSRSKLATEHKDQLLVQASTDTPQYIFELCELDIQSADNKSQLQKEEASNLDFLQSPALCSPVTPDINQFSFRCDIRSSDIWPPAQKEEVSVAGVLHSTCARRQSVPDTRSIRSWSSPGPDVHPRLERKPSKSLLGNPNQSDVPKRARTPEGCRSRGEVISCPMLWGGWELSVLMRCLGVNADTVKRMQAYRCRGAAQILAMSDSDLRHVLGLNSPVERLVVRRTLHILLEVDSANNYQKRTQLDVCSDPNLNTYLVPLTDLKLQSMISSGGFGKVYRGVLNPTADRGSMRAGKQQAVAAKAMMGGYQTRLYELLKEARVMASLRHPNICQFLGVCADSSPTGQRYLLSALASCSLQDLIHQPAKVRQAGSLTVRKVIGISRNICAGLAYIHDKKLVHADLKSGNILIDISSKLVPKICDFGHAAVRAVPAPHHRLGTPHWAAPEVLRGESLGQAADIFSCGVIIWEMLMREYPHKRLSFAQIIVCVGWAGSVPELAQLPKLTPATLKSLLSECLHFLPEKRPDAQHLHKQLSSLRRAARHEARTLLETFLGSCACGISN